VKDYIEENRLLAKFEKLIRPVDLSEIMSGYPMSSEEMKDSELLYHKAIRVTVKYELLETLTHVLLHIF